MGALLGMILVVYLYGHHPTFSMWKIGGLAAIPRFIFCLAGTLWNDRKVLQEQGKVFQEQLSFAEAQH